jgi:integrase
MSKRLTALSVENAKAGTSRREISDGGSGLYLIVQTSGHKSYAARFRVRGVPKKFTLTSTTLADARVEAAEAIRQAKAGNDPCKAKVQADIQRAANTFGYIAQKYLDSDKVRKLRSIGQMKDYLNRLILPTFGDTPIADIRRRQVAELLDRIEARSGPVAADRALSAMTGVFKLYQKRDDDFVSPIVEGMNRASAKDRARDRKLTDDEIRKLWAAGNQFAQFLLLTGARRTEVAAMQWKEIDGNDWTLPAARNKAKVDLIRTLPKAAMAVLPQRGHDDEYVFGTPNSPLKSFSLLKARLDKASGVTSWRLHDLRRTARSLMSRAGCNSDHSERVLGHVIGGVRGIYDRHEFYAEKAHVLERLAHQLATIVSPPKGGNVRVLRRA